MARQVSKPQRGFVDEQGARWQGCAGRPRWGGDGLWALKEEEGGSQHWKLDSQKMAFSPRWRHGSGKQLALGWLWCWAILSLAVSTTPRGRPGFRDICLQLGLTILSQGPQHGTPQLSSQTSSPWIQMATFWSVHTTPGRGRSPKTWWVSGLCNPGKWGLQKDFILFRKTKKCH